MYYVIFFTDSRIGDYNSILLVFVSYLVRASSIAGKYATFPANKIKYIKRKKITYKEIDKELMLIGWFQQKPYVIEQEIGSTMKRQEIDDTLFRLSFMAPLSKRAEKKFLEIRDNHKEYYKTNTMTEFRKCADDGKEIWYYDAKVIFEFLITEFNKRDNTFTKWKFVIFFVLSLVYGISPGIFRSFYGETFHGEDWLAILAFYLNGYSSGFLMLTAIMFFTSAKRDMRRRSFILRQLG